MLKIRPLEQNELPQLRTFAPPDWNTDLSVTFGRHLGKPYFHAIVAELDGALAGCANGLLNSKTGWLGNIIVLPEFRGHGIGTALTQTLVDHFRSRRCRSQVLVATVMGEPVYRRLGFEIVSQYLFLKKETPSTQKGPSRVRLFRQEDRQAVLSLDRSISGEEREQFLEQFIGTAWVHESSPGEVDGFYLPDLGQGPILARNDKAGQELLIMKLSLGCQSIVVPEENLFSLDFLNGAGFKEINRAPRMVLGDDTCWRPTNVYARGSGYCG